MRDLSRVDIITLMKQIEKFRLESVPSLEEASSDSKGCQVLAL
jgi:hypothetical protein